MRLSIFFFFQAEDGIRDVAVTGVQTCALPICPHPACTRQIPVRGTVPTTEKPARASAGVLAVRACRRTGSVAASLSLDPELCQHAPEKGIDRRPKKLRQ